MNVVIQHSLKAGITAVIKGNGKGKNSQHNFVFNNTQIPLILNVRINF